MTTPKQQQELEPCPFCGASGEDLMLFCDPAEARDNSGPSRRIQCAQCHIEAPYYDTEVEAITAWNTRTPAATADREVLVDAEFIAEITLNVITLRGDPTGELADIERAANRILTALRASDRDAVIEELEANINLKADAIERMTNQAAKDHAEIERLRKERDALELRVAELEGWLDYILRLFPCGIFSDNVKAERDVLTFMLHTTEAEKVKESRKALKGEPNA